MGTFQSCRRAGTYVSGKGKRKKRDAKGVKVRFIRGQRYLGGFYRGREEMEAWLLSKIAKWAETI